MLADTDVLHAARTGVRRVTRYVVTFGAIPTLGFAYVVAKIQQRTHGVLLVELVVLCVTAIVLWIDKERSRTVGAVILCAAFFIINSCALLQFGPLMGTGMMVMTWSLFMVFFFDIVAQPLLLVFLQMVGAAVVAEGQVIALSWTMAEGVPGWIRMTSTVLMLTALVTYLSRRLVRGLQDAIRREMEARGREAEARVEREAMLHELAQSRRLEAIGVLAGGVAHDFNNVLTVLVTSLEVLRRETSEPVRLEVLREMERACQGAAATTRQLLSFARQGSQPSEGAAIGDLLPSLCKSLARILPEKIRVIADVQTTAHVALGTGLLEQALLNLCLNARDAMPDGGVLTLRAKSSGSGQGDRVVLEVEDTGQGMAPDVERKASEPFFSTKAETGLGLGLAMVRRSVEGAGGELQITSLEHRGTCVRLVLPVGTAPEAVASNEDRQTAGVRILVVEDDMAVLQMMRRLLQTSGYQVHVAQSCAEAIQLLDTASSFDLLLTDGCLPDGDSSPVIERFRADQSGRPVLIFSGYVASEDLIQTVEAGRCKFLQKPAGFAELRSAIEELLRGA